MKLAREKRVQTLKKRKNLLPTLTVAIVCGVSMVGILIFIDPDDPGALLAFFVTCFLTVFLSAAIIFDNTRRGLLVALGLCVFLFLRYLDVGNILNAVLIVGIALVVEYYFNQV